MRGLIIKNDEQNFLRLGNVFKVLGDETKKYNWLITDMFYVPEYDEHEFYTNPYTWLTGDELSEKMKKDNSYWIWGVLSGFSKEIPLDSILKYPLPIADGYGRFWEPNLSIQHPLASVELVPWDSTLLLAITENDTILDRLQIEYPFAQDLERYNLTE